MNTCQANLSAARLTPLPKVIVNVPKFVEYFTSEFSDYAINNYAVITWFDCMIDPNRTYAQSVRDFNKIMRACTQERIKKEKAQAKAKAKAVKAEAKAKARPKAKAKAARTLPTIPEEEPKPEPLFDVAKELADAEQVRDYIDSVEARVKGESWAIITKIDTLILKQWLADVSVYQVALNNNATTRRAVLPKPIKLIADESFSSPMLDMGKRESNVNNLKKVSFGTPSENRGKINTIISLYKDGKILNYATAENIVERLSSKTKRSAYVAKTESKYSDTVSAKGKSTRELS